MTSLTVIKPPPAATQSPSSSGNVLMLGVPVVGHVITFVKHWDPQKHPKGYKGLFIDTPSKIKAKDATVGDVVAAKSGKVFQVEKATEKGIKVKPVNLETGEVKSGYTVLGHDVQLAVVVAGKGPGTAHPVSDLDPGTFIKTKAGKRFKVSKHGKWTTVYPVDDHGIVIGNHTVLPPNTVVTVDAPDVSATVDPEMIKTLANVAAKLKNIEAAPEHAVLKGALKLWLLHGEGASVMQTLDDHAMSEGKIDGPYTATDVTNAVMEQVVANDANSVVDILGGWVAKELDNEDYDLGLETVEDLTKQLDDAIGPLHSTPPPGATLQDGLEAWLGQPNVEIIKDLNNAPSKPLGTVQVGDKVWKGDSATGVIKAFVVDKLEGETGFHLDGQGWYDVADSGLWTKDPTLVTAKSLVAGVQEIATSKDDVDTLVKKLGVVMADHDGYHYTSAKDAADAMMAQSEQDSLAAFLKLYEPKLVAPSANQPTLPQYQVYQDAMLQWINDDDELLPSLNEFQKNTAMDLSDKGFGLAAEVKLKSQVLLQNSAQGTGYVAPTWKVIGIRGARLMVHGDGTPPGVYSQMRPEDLKLVTPSHAQLMGAPFTGGQLMDDALGHAEDGLNMDDVQQAMTALGYAVSDAFGYSYNTPQDALTLAFNVKQREAMFDAMMNAWTKAQQAPVPKTQLLPPPMPLWQMITEKLDGKSPQPGDLGWDLNWQADDQKTITKLLYQKQPTTVEGVMGVVDEWYKGRGIPDPETGQIMGLYDNPDYLEVMQAGLAPVFDEYAQKLAASMPKETIEEILPTKLPKVPKGYPAGTSKDSRVIILSHSGLWAVERQDKDGHVLQVLGTAGSKSQARKIARDVSADYEPIIEQMQTYAPDVYAQMDAQNFKPGQLLMGEAGLIWRLQGVEYQTDTDWLGHERTRPKLTVRKIQLVADLQEKRTIADVKVGDTVWIPDPETGEGLLPHEVHGVQTDVKGNTTQFESDGGEYDHNDAYVVFNDPNGPPVKQTLGGLRPGDTVWRNGKPVKVQSVFVNGKIETSAGAVPKDGVVTKVWTDDGKTLAQIDLSIATIALDDPKTPKVLRETDAMTMMSSSNGALIASLPGDETLSLDQLLAKTLPTLTADKPQDFHATNKSDYQSSRLDRTAYWHLAQRKGLMNSDESILRAARPSRYTPLLHYDWDPASLKGATVNEALKTLGKIGYREIKPRQKTQVRMVNAMGKRLILARDGNTITDIEEVNVPSLHIDGDALSFHEQLMAAFDSGGAIATLDPRSSTVRAQQTSSARNLVYDLAIGYQHKVAAQIGKATGEKVKNDAAYMDELGQEGLLKPLADYLDLATMPEYTVSNARAYSVLMFGVDDATPPADMHAWSANDWFSPDGTVHTKQVLTISQATALSAMMKRRGIARLVAQPQDVHVGDSPSVAYLGTYREIPVGTEFSRGEPGKTARVEGKGDDDTVHIVNEQGEQITVPGAMPTPAEWVVTKVSDAPIAKYRPELKDDNPVEGAKKMGDAFDQYTADGTGPIADLPEQTRAYVLKTMDSWHQLAQQILTERNNEHQRRAEALQTADVQQEIDARRATEGTVKEATTAGLYDLPVWEEVQFQPQTWEGIDQLVAQIHQPYRPAPSRAEVHERFRQLLQESLAKPDDFGSLPAPEAIDDTMTVAEEAIASASDTSDAQSLLNLYNAKLGSPDFLASEAIPIPKDVRQALIAFDREQPERDMAYDVPAFYTGGYIKDGVLMHDQDLTLAQVEFQDDGVVTHRLLSEGAVEEANTRPLTPGHNGSYKMYDGVQLTLVDESTGEQARPPTQAEKQARALDDFAQAFSDANLDTSGNMAAVVWSALVTTYPDEAKDPEKLVLRYNNQVVQQSFIHSINRPVWAVDPDQLAEDKQKAVSAVEAAYQTEESVPPTAVFDAIDGAENHDQLKDGVAGAIADNLAQSGWGINLVNKVVDAYKTGLPPSPHDRVRRIEYVLHDQVPWNQGGAPTNQRGELRLVGYTPREAAAKLQEMGLLGDLESQVPFKSLMRSTRRFGPPAFILPEYVRGEASLPTSKARLSHGITNAHAGNAVDTAIAILQSGGLMSITERHRQGILKTTQGASAAGDIRSGIDHAVFTTLNGGWAVGSSADVKFILRPHALLRRDIVLSPTDYGSAETRYPQYRSYLNGLQAKVGEVKTNLYTPVSPAVRQRHLDDVSLTDSNEYNVSPTVPIEDMEYIAVPSQDAKTRIDGVLDQMMKDGQIAARPEVIVGSGADKSSLPITPQMAPAVELQEGDMVIVKGLPKMVFKVTGVPGVNEYGNETTEVTVLHPGTGNVLKIQPYDIAHKITPLPKGILDTYNLEPGDIVFVENFDTGQMVEGTVAGENDKGIEVQVHDPEYSYPTTYPGDTVVKPPINLKDPILSISHPNQVELPKPLASQAWKQGDRFIYQGTLWTAQEGGAHVKAMSTLVKADDGTEMLFYPAMVVAKVKSAFAF